MNTVVMLLSYKSVNVTHMFDFSIVFEKTTDTISQSS